MYDEVRVAARAHVRLEPALVERLEVLRELRAEEAAKTGPPDAERSQKVAAALAKLTQVASSSSSTAPSLPHTPTLTDACVALPFAADYEPDLRRRSTGRGGPCPVRP